MLRKIKSFEINDDSPFDINNPINRQMNNPRMLDKPSDSDNIKIIENDEDVEIVNKEGITSKTSNSKTGGYQTDYDTTKETKSNAENDTPPTFKLNIIGGDTNNSDQLELCLIKDKTPNIDNVKLVINFKYNLAKDTCEGIISELKSEIDMSDEEEEKLLISLKELSK